jgi:hypothetical protein
MGCEEGSYPALEKCELGHVSRRYGRDFILCSSGVVEPSAADNRRLCG